MKLAVVVIVCLFVIVATSTAESSSSEADEAQTKYQASLFDMFLSLQGESSDPVKYTDLNPMRASIHTIAPAFPKLNVGMNASGSKMFHVHSDERGNNDEYSAEIMSSGLTAGFTFTNRDSGRQKGDGSSGTAWTLYSGGKIMKINDGTTAGDLISIADGMLLIQGNAGDGAKAPTVTIRGGSDSMSQLSLISRATSVDSTISVFNKSGDFGIKSGAGDKAIPLFSLTKDGLLATVISSGATGEIRVACASENTQQTLRLQGGAIYTSLFHSNGKFGLYMKGSGEGSTILSINADGSSMAYTSISTNPNLSISGQVSGGSSAMTLLSNQGGSAFGYEMRSKGLTLTFSQLQGTTVTPVMKIDDAGKFTMPGEALIGGFIEVVNNGGKKDMRVMGNVKIDGQCIVDDTDIKTAFKDMKTAQEETKSLRARLSKLEALTESLQSTLITMTEKL